MTRFTILVGVLICAGCATPPMTPAPEPTPVAYAQPDPVPAPPPIPPVPVEGPEEPPLTVIEQANRAALVTPRRAWFTGGLLRYPYRHGQWYRVDTSVQQPTTLVFGPDEVVETAMGLEGKEAERWTVKIPKTRDGEREVWYIMPTRAKQQAGVTVITNKGIYPLQLFSHAKTGLLAVSWEHPAAVKPLTAPSWDTGVLWVGYAWKAGKVKPLWEPTQVWDTGATGKTVIQFPQAVGVVNAPGVWAENAAGVLEQVNFRTDPVKRRYVLDLIATRLVLKSGVGKAAETVTVTRGAQYRQVTCPGTDGCP